MYPNLRQFESFELNPYLRSTRREDQLTRTTRNRAGRPRAWLLVTVPLAVVTVVTAIAVG